MTGLRVAFDLDGVLANLEQPYSAAKQALFGSDDPQLGAAQEATTEDESGPRSRALTRTQQSDIWRRIARVSNFWTTLDPLEPGVVRAIQALARGITGMSSL